jgi:hypothetical protein
MEVDNNGGVPFLTDRVFWIQTKLDTRCRSLVYHVEALTRHAKILAKTRGGLGQAAWNPILPHCGLVPFPPARAVTACSKSGDQIPIHPMASRWNSLPNPDPLHNSSYTRVRGMVNTGRCMPRVLYPVEVSRGWQKRGKPLFLGSKDARIQKNKKTKKWLKVSLTDYQPTVDKHRLLISSY